MSKTHTAHALSRISRESQLTAFRNGVRQRSSAWDGRPTSKQERRSAKRALARGDY